MRVPRWLDRALDVFIAAGDLGAFCSFVVFLVLFEASLVRLVQLLQLLWG